MSELHYFELGEDPRDYGRRVIYDIADAVGADVTGSRPEVDNLFKVSQAVQSQLRLDEHSGLVSDRWTVAEAADVVYRSGLLTEMKRTFYSRGLIDPIARRLVSMDSGQGMLQGMKQIRRATLPFQIVVTGSRRRMNTVVDVADPNVRHYKKRFGRLPTEREYAGTYLISDMDYTKKPKGFDFVWAKSADPERTMREAFADRDKAGGVDFESDSVVCHMGKGYSLLLACRARYAGRMLFGGYDFSPIHPHVFYTQEQSKPARTTEELDNPELVNPYEGILTIARTIMWMSRIELHKEKQWI